jgi:hypothetical protein
MIGAGEEIGEKVDHDKALLLSLERKRKRLELRFATFDALIYIMNLRSYGS